MVKTLYVGNIPWSLTEEELQEELSRYGKIQACRIITEKPSGRSRGYGFVEVEDDIAETILEEADGMEVGGRHLVINEARPRTRETVE